MFAAEKVGFINVDGAIGPATASYISRSIDEAKTQNVRCLVIQLNTPGGLLDSTQKIVQSFLGSPVPVVVYVAPTGATATSAGCFITLAANVAAMAPATTIGAAHPVSIGGFPSGGEEKPDETMEREISDFRQTRERQLQEQLMRMREGIVKEITDVVMEKVKGKGLDFVLDKSGVSINGVPVVLYAPENVDFTNEIIEVLNKPGRATAATRKPAAAASVSPAAARATKP